MKWLTLTCIQRGGVDRISVESWVWAVPRRVVLPSLITSPSLPAAVRPSVFLTHRFRRSLLWNQNQPVPGLRGGQSTRPQQQSRHKEEVREGTYPSQLCRHLYSSLIPSPYLEWGYLHSRHWPQDTYNLRTLGCTVLSVTWNATANFSYVWILLYSGSRNTQSSECTVASVEHVEMFHGKSQLTFVVLKWRPKGY